MAKKSPSKLEILETEKALTGKQDWEIDAGKMTEKEKRKWYQNHVETTQKGNPNMRGKTKKVYRFAPPTKAQEEMMKYLDHYGNPLPGYKWDGNKITIDVDYREKVDNNRLFSYVKSENRAL